MMTNEISITDLNELFNQKLGQSFTRCEDDNSGCYMTRRGFWMSPKVITEIVHELFDALGVEIPEPDRNEKLRAIEETWRNDDCYDEGILEHGPSKTWSDDKVDELYKEAVA